MATINNQQMTHYKLNEAKTMLVEVPTMDEPLLEDFHPCSSVISCENDMVDFRYALHQYEVYP